MRRMLTVALTWAILHGICWGQAAPAGDATGCPEACRKPQGTGDQISHLRKAAEHLEAAGRTDQARTLRAEADALAKLNPKTASPQVLLSVKIFEVSRTRMRAKGFDFAPLGAAPEWQGIKPGVSVKICPPGDGLSGFLKALVQEDLAKVLAEPTLVVVPGRPASYFSGGEFPVPKQKAGESKVEYKRFGTQVDAVVQLLDDARVRLEIRPCYSYLDPSLNIKVNDVTVPGLVELQLDTACEMPLGHTAVLGGLVRQRVARDEEAADKAEEMQVLFLVTPHLLSQPTAQQASAATSIPTY